jgi:hypothetical protein
MTISSTNRKAGPFLGTGAVSEYPFDFTVFAAADLLVVMADVNGDETTLVLSSDYTVTLNGDQDASPGGTVVLTDPLPDDHLLVITSDIDALQPSDITNQGGFYPRVVERALDRVTILVQQLGDRMSRALVSPISSGLNGTQYLSTLITDLSTLAGNTAVATVNALLAVFGQRLDGHDEAISNIAASYTIRTWATGQSYGPGTVGSTTDTRDVVLVGGVWYIATTDHTAGAVFADDLAAGRWMNTDPVQLRGDLATPGADKGAAMVAFLSTLGLSSTDAQAAIDEVFANTRKPRNIIHNAELRNLFRNGGGTPPTTLSAGQFLIDRWKAGSEGLTRPSATAINGEVEWSDGTLVQVLKDFGTNSAYPDGIESLQQVTFAWEGTAVGRIGNGEWRTSPFTFATVGISEDPYLEFGIADGATSATMSEPRAAFGAIDPGFYPLPRSEAEPLLERYFQRVSVLHQFVAGAGAQTEIWTESHARMAAVPTPTYVGSPSYINTTLATLTAGTTNRFYISMPSTAAGAVRLTATVALDTGL